MGAYFWSIALSLTSLPYLARILSDLKLMYTDLGKMALTAAVVNDLSCSCLLVVALCLINGEKELYVAILVLLCMTIFWFSLRPFIRFITELCGAHSFFGAFMFGLMISGGELGSNIKEKVEEFVVGILLRPMFLLTGTRTNIEFIFADYFVGLVILVILMAISAKIVATLLVCLYFKCPMRDGLALGVLMNTKGVLAIIILNEGLNMKSYNDRHLVKSKPDTPLRVLACVHSTGNLSGLLSLLQISNATRKSPITVFAVHLVELAGRTSAMLIFHDKNKTIDTGNNCSKEKAEAEQIVSTFKSFENDNHGATVKPLTVVSPYVSMHKDVNNFALDKFANIILIPFHKRPDTSGGWTDENLQHETVNQNLLETSPCSIGLLVDRGLTCFSESKKGMRECRVTMLFVEGPDEREALAYAWKMAGNPRLMFTLVRFVPGKQVSELVENDNAPYIFTDRFERERQKQLDDDYINEFRFRTMHDQSITYIEKQVNSGDQIVSAISDAYNDFDLYVVGRGHGRTFPLTEGLANWSEFPELGPLGETLVSMDLESPASVLIVQQSCPTSSGSKKNKTSNPSKEIFGVETFCE
ncbi:Cation proton exchanger [Hibiscus syriacus]|uniref:Cation proton exchanger n=1 Tax=Hibiscus syriacus TaxID=106335 RepID=A0A6A3C040_HIBSY|nr:Cation proton exchanger [Hibiscus syriacus]